MDNVLNKFGDCLLDLCKATNLCNTHNGESMIDYILTKSKHFEAFENVTVHDYSEFSNHAPISFSLKIGTQRSREVTENFRDIYRWNENCKNDLLLVYKMI